MEIKRVDSNHIEVILNRKSVLVGPSGSGTGDVVLHTSIPQGDVAPKEGMFFEPGEYEVQGIMVDGVQTDKELVSYHIVHDGIMIAAVVLKSIDALTDEIVEHLQPSQVLCIWLEEGAAGDVATLLGKLEATIAVPVALPFEATELERVVKTPTETAQTIKISLKEISSEQPKLYILS